MVSETQEKINSIESTLNTVQNRMDNGHYDSATVWVGSAQTEALLLIARQLGELIALFSAVAVDMTTEGD